MIECKSSSKSSAAVGFFNSDKSRWLAKSDNELGLSKHASMILYIPNDGGAADCLFGFRAQRSYGSEELGGGGYSSENSARLAIHDPSGLIQHRPDVRHVVEARNPLASIVNPLIVRGLSTSAVSSDWKSVSTISKYAIPVSGAMSDIVKAVAMASGSINTPKVLGRKNSYHFVLGRKVNIGSQASLVGVFKPALDALEEISKTLQEEAWDGDQARPVSLEAISSAKVFLNELELELTLEKIQPPDVNPEYDGDVELEWFLDKNNRVGVSFSAGGILYWAARESGAASCGKGELKDVFSDLLKKIKAVEAKR